MAIPFSLFLLDFDGLLVDTEEVHFRAYKSSIEERGFSFPFDFDRYQRCAHQDSAIFRKTLFEESPGLDQLSWASIYDRKKEIYLASLLQQPPSLMEGADRLLFALRKERIATCVVTNSSREHTTVIVRMVPELQLIDHWVTREDYSQPKPHSECYEKAISLHHRGDGRVVGLEDTIRGLQALLPTKAEPTLIAKRTPPKLPERAFHCETLHRFCDHFQIF